MNQARFLVLLAAESFRAMAAHAQPKATCTDLTGLKISGVEITKANHVQTSTMVPPLYPGAPGIGPLPAHCRVDGVINRRVGVDGQEFGIGFAGALPEPAAWNGDFM